MGRVKRALDAAHASIATALLFTVYEPFRSVSKVRGECADARSARAPGRSLGNLTVAARWYAQPRYPLAHFRLRVAKVALNAGSGYVALAQSAYSARGLSSRIFCTALALSVSAWRFSRCSASITAVVSPWL